MGVSFFLSGLCFGPICDFSPADIVQMCFVRDRIFNFYVFRSLADGVGVTESCVFHLSGYYHSYEVVVVTQRTRNLLNNYMKLLN